MTGQYHRYYRCTSAVKLHVCLCVGQWGRLTRYEKKRDSSYTPFLQE